MLKNGNIKSRHKYFWMFEMKKNHDLFVIEVKMCDFGITRDAMTHSLIYINFTLIFFLSIILVYCTLYSWCSPFPIAFLRRNQHFSKKSSLQFQIHWYKHWKIILWGFRKNIEKRNSLLPNCNQNDFLLENFDKLVKKETI